MAIFHVKYNGQSNEVIADSSSNAIRIFLDSLESSDEPDQCLNSANSGICICAEYAGEPIEETP